MFPLKTEEFMSKLVMEREIDKYNMFVIRRLIVSSLEVLGYCNPNRIQTRKRFARRVKQAQLLGKHIGKSQGSFACSTLRAKRFLV